MATLTSPISSLNPTDSQNVDIQQQSNIVALQSQVGNIQSEVGVINSGLQGIANLIRNDSLLEQTRLLEEQKREKLFTERRIRTGKQEQIEQTLDASIQRPIDSLTPKVTSSFDGLSKAFASLFTGFLGPKILGLIGNSVKVGVNALKGVKSLIGKSFQFIGKAFSGLGSGFKNILGKIGGLGKKISEIGLKLVTSPFKAIADLFKGAMGLFGGGAAAATRAAGTGGGILDDILKGIGTAVRVVGGPIVGGAAITALDVASGTPLPEAAAGATGSLALGFAGARVGSILGPGGAILGGVGGGFFGSSAGKDLLKYTFGGNFGKFTTNFTNLTNDLGFKIDLGMNSIKNVFGIPSDNNPPPTPNPTLPPSSPQPSSQIQTPSEPVNPISVPIISNESGQSGQNAQPANIEHPPKPAPVGATPPPPPDVIMASTISQNQSSSQRSSRSGPITDVPLLPSANIDNFYTLYSQTHYNVVM